MKRDLKGDKILIFHLNGQNESADCDKLYKMAYLEQELKKICTKRYTRKHYR